MDKLPPIDPLPYDNRKFGFFGKLGRGQSVEICFLQTGLRHNDLESIDLVENIPGSERWEVKDLFQRDVDEFRVTSSLSDLGSWVAKFPWASIRLQAVDRRGDEQLPSG